jgi:hypothetical protein
MPHVRPWPPVVYSHDIKKLVVRSPVIQLLFTWGEYQWGEWAWTGKTLPPALRSNTHDGSFSLEAEQVQPSFGDGQAIPQHARVLSLILPGRPVVAYPRHAE